jgi:hypothetical protein
MVMGRTHGAGLGLSIAASILLGCSSDSAKKTEPAPAATPAKAPPPPRSAPASRPSDPETDALVQKTMGLYIAAEHDKAIEIARKILERDPENQKAWQIVGACSCFKKDWKGVEEAKKHLSPYQLKLLEQICERAKGESPKSKSSP